MNGGNCHEAAVRLQDRWAKMGQELDVVQGMVDMGIGGRDWHSWCEADGMVYDNSNSARLTGEGVYSPDRGVAGGVRGGKMLVEPVADYCSGLNVDQVRRYTALEVAQHMIRTGLYGVWEPSVTQTVTRRGPLRNGEGL